MRAFSNYNLLEWIKFSPVIDQLKAMRNDRRLQNYLQIKPASLNTFLSTNSSLKGKNIVSVVAFNRPELITWAIKVNTKLIIDASLVIFDNSSKASAREAIEAICKTANIPYFSLPKNPEKHPSRSHGLALTWIYYHVFKFLDPKVFALLDHDLYPLKKVSVEEIIGEAPFYGVYKPSQWAWNLWAGFSFFNYQKIKQYPVNFNNDRPNGLDTGGMNWPVLYRKFDKSNVRFPSYERVVRSTADGNHSFDTDNIDDTWIHFRGAYTTNFKKANSLTISDLLKHCKEIYNDLAE